MKEKSDGARSENIAVKYNNATVIRTGIIWITKPKSVEESVANKCSTSNWKTKTVESELCIINEPFVLNDDNQTI